MRYDTRFGFCDGLGVVGIGTWISKITLQMVSGFVAKRQVYTESRCRL